MKPALAVLLLTASAAPAVVLAAPPPEKILLQDLVGQGVPPPDVAALTSATCHALGARPGLDLLCGDDLRALLQWQAAATSLDACRDEACRSAAARGLEARLVVSGTVSKVGEGVVLALALLDARAGQVRGRAEIEAKSVAELHPQVAKAIGRLFEAPVRGR